MKPKIFLDAKRSSEMKILIITSWYPTKDHPVSGSFIKDQALTLVNKNSVCVLYLRDILSLKHFLNKGTKTLREFLDNGIYTIELSTYNWLPKIPLAGIKLWLYYTYLAFKGFKMVVKKFGKPDIIHAHVSFPAGYAASLISKRYRIPFVLTEHTGPFDSLLRQTTIKLIVKKTIQHSQVIIAVSKALKKEIVKHIHPLNIMVVPNMVDTEFFRPPTHSRHFKNTKMLVVALMSEVKGISYLLKAIHMLIDKGSRNIYIDFVGDGPARKTLEAEARELGLSQYVKFHGIKQREDVKKIMQNCNFLILPSLHETFGVVIIEAMACGKPVLATRCGGPEYIITENTGKLVAKADIMDLCEGILYMMNNYHTYNSKTIRDYVVKNYSKEKISKQLTEIYNNAIHSYIV